MSEVIEGMLDCLPIEQLEYFCAKTNTQAVVDAAWHPFDPYDESTWPEQYHCFSRPLVVILKRKKDRLIRL